MPYSESTARQIWVTDADGREWHGSLTPLQGEAGHAFTLTCRKVVIRSQTDRLFPDGKDLVVFNAPHHVAILHRILLTFRPSFPGMRDRKLLPPEVRGICERVTHATVDFLDSADHIKEVRFTLPEALAITATQMHQLDGETTTVAHPDQERVLPFGKGRLLTLKFKCSMSSSNVERRTTHTDVCFASIAFDPAVTADTALANCHDLRLLIGLLNGTPLTSRSAFLVAANGANGETCLGPIAPTERQFREEVLPFWSEGRSQLRLEHLIESFLSQRDRLLPALGAALFCLFHSRNLETRLLATLPTLEQLLGNDFNAADEADFMDRQKEFFAWVDQKPELAEFARKHCKVVQSKAPTLAMRFERLANHLNTRGARFPTDVGTALARLRNRRFHSSDTGGQSGDQIYRDQIAATAMLTFRVLDLLGIRPDEPGLERSRVAELREFLTSPPA